MKIPEFLHPVLGVIIGTVIFLAAVTVLSVVFVIALKTVQYAAPLAEGAIDSFLSLWHTP